MSRNLTQMNTSQRKQADAHEREAAVDEIENEITMLTKSHQETRDRIKSLKASKKTYVHKGKSSSKAESNSSGHVRTTISSSAKAKKVTTAAKVDSKKGTLPFPYCFQVFFTPVFLNNTSRNQIKVGFPVIQVEGRLDR